MSSTCCRFCVAILALSMHAASTFAADPAKDIERLRDWLRGPNSEHWLRAAREAKELAPASKVLLPELCELTLNSSKPIRQAAIEAVEVNDKLLYEAVMTLLTEHPSVTTKRDHSAYQAVRPLKRLGENARPAVGMLLKIGELETAAEIAPDDERVIKQAIKLSSSRATRARGLGVLNKVDLDDKTEPQAIDCMISGIKEGHILIVYKRLGEMGASARKAIPVLKEAKGAREARAREAASDALDRIELAISSSD